MTTTDWLVSGEPQVRSRLHALLDQPVWSQRSTKAAPVTLEALADALDAGMSAPVALDHLTRTLPTASARAAATLAETMAGGALLPDALAAHPDVFGPAAGPLTAHYARHLTAAQGLRRAAAFVRPIPAGVRRYTAPGAALPAAAVASLVAATGAAGPFAWLTYLLALATILTAVGVAFIPTPTRVTASVLRAALTVIADLTAAAVPTRAALTFVTGLEVDGAARRALTSAASAVWAGQPLAVAVTDLDRHLPVAPALTGAEHPPPAAWAMAAQALKPVTHLSRPTLVVLAMSAATWVGAVCALTL